MTFKCCYCDQEIRGYHGQGWFLIDRLPSSFKDVLVMDNISPQSFTPIREKICKDCFKLLQHDSRREKHYTPDIEIYDTKNLKELEK